jgi:opacity protein-like surface antigen
MKKTTVLAAALFLLVPTLAFSDSISIRAGFYLPRGVTGSYLNAHPDSLWTIELDQMSFAPRDYNAGIVGFSYDYFVGKYVNLSLSLDAYNHSEVGFYLDWVVNSLDEGDFAFPYEYYLGNDIQHSFRVTVTPLQLSLKVLPLGRRTRVVPYVGGGASLFFWNIRMFGDMIDFNPVDELGNPVQYYYPDPELGDVVIYPVFAMASHESGTTFGWHALGGVQVPIGYRATIDAEARYHSARANLHKLFQGFDTFELGGWEFTVGLSYWF